MSLTFGLFTVSNSGPHVSLVFTALNASQRLALISDTKQSDLSQSDLSLCPLIRSVCPNIGTLL